MKKLILVVCFFIQVNIALCAPQTSPTSADFDKLVDETFDSFYKFSPTQATADGFHQYDTKLEDFSRATVNAEVGELRNLLGKLQAFPRGGLPEISTADLDF